MLGSPLAWAAPALRLSVPDALKRPVWIENGTNGPANLSFEAWNNGDGQLNLAANGGLIEWLRPEVGGSQPCAFDPARICFTIRVLFATDSLAPGTYTGDVIVEDPNAVDAPQRVSIKIYVGGNVPGQIDLYAPPLPNASDFRDFQTPEGPAPRFDVAGDFLLVTSDNLGSFRFLHTHRVLARYNSTLGEGELPATVRLMNSTFPADNKEVGVTFHVTREPILDRSPAALSFATAEGVQPPDQFLSVSNRGMGDLSISQIETETGSGGEWLSVEEAAPGLFGVRAEAGGLTAGLYRGRVRFSANAANSPVETAVWFFVSPQAAPILSFRGAVNGATFNNTMQLTPGSIVSIFGQQLSYATAQATEVPLPRELSQTKVLIDGIEAPLFFVSYGQVNVQIPYEVGQGTKEIQLLRDGQPGNRINASFSDRSAGIFRLGVREYGAIRNATQGNFPLPLELGQQLGVNAAPARIGDVLEIFATGLGAVNPSVATGEAAGVDPLSEAVEMPEVVFGRSAFGPRTRAEFVGLTPGFVGLFQINVAVPEGVPTDDRLAVSLAYRDGRSSNVVEIAVER